jgi:TonB family protein
MTKLHSHYEVLNVTREAPAEVIRAAYRSLSQKHHPDKNNGDDHAAALMSRLNLAYSVLSNADQRQLYDLILDEQIAADATAAYQASRAREGVAAAQAGYSVDTLKRSAGAQSMDGQLSRALIAWIIRARRYATGRDGRIVAMVLGAAFVALIPIFWVIWKDHRAMLRLEQAVVYTPRVAVVSVPQPIPAPTARKVLPPAGKAVERAPAVVATAPVPSPVAAATQPAKPATPVKPADAPPATAKTFEIERLTAMLKSMGLGVHKLDAPAPAAQVKRPSVPAPAAEPDKPAVAAKPSAVPASRAAAARPAVLPDAARAREEAERTAAADLARAEAKSLSEPARANVSASAAASSPSTGPRQAIIADARACVAPPYPVSASRNGESGTVQLALLVTNDGRVIESKVHKSSGSPDLDRAARKALSQCRFKAPGTDRQAEPVWAMMEYVFSLD